MLFFCVIAPASASAAASYAFEPTLSLTGNCKTTPLDEVPDPGPCPGTPKIDHPSAGFQSPGVTVDAYGDIYVANMVGETGRIDVFSPEGFFITEFKDEAGPQSLAVDSEGNVYLFERLQGGERQVRRFPPVVYKPEEEEIEYGAAIKIVGYESPPFPFESGPFGAQELRGSSSVAVDPATDELYVDTGGGVVRLDSAKEENKLLEEGAITGLSNSTAIAIDAKHKKIYVSDRDPATLKSIIRVFDLAPPHKELGKITGSTTPKGEFLAGEGFLAIDVDERFGHVFVGDFTAEKVYEFEEDGTYLATIEHSLEGATSVGGTLGEIAVDDGPFSPHPQKEGWLFVPSVSAPSLGHVYAFEPVEEGPPAIEETSVSGVTETEAVLHAKINPEGIKTSYRLEYVTQLQFEEEEGKSFENENAMIASEGTLPKGAEGIDVSAPALGLEPDTAYRFRAFAENGKGSDAEEKTFNTFPPDLGSEPCENDPLRTGNSAGLPDCRAYELVTPSDTNGRPPTGGFSGVFFAYVTSSSAGDRLSYLIEGGTIPGFKGTGTFNGDRYLATRGPEGWTSELAGPTGEEASGPNPGSTSPDQTYSLWEDKLAPAVYVRYPDGHSELVGQGSLGEVPKVNAHLVTENGTHVIFTSAVPLEPNAAPEGTATVYDRSAEGGPTHVVSLLPGDEPQKAKEDALYLGASEDGEGIAFSIAGTIYVRLHNAETQKAAAPGATFAGISEEGKRVFYLQGGNLFAYDTGEEKTIPFSASGDITPVNVASGGTRAYLVSPSVLSGEPNPNGEEGKKGAENLYLSEEGQFSFVGIVTERDVEGENPGTGQVGGLGLWTSGLQFQAPDINPSRTTPSGVTFLFESRADLTDFESDGFAQVYRYDSEEGRLDCLSCSPTGKLPVSDASLQSIQAEQLSPEPAGGHLKIPNQSPDGKRAFFQTAEKLALEDTDGKLDVYEWEENEVGSCRKPGGCAYLISGGHSASPDYLFAMSSSGDDVFFRTSDLLLSRDAENTLSIYDARVGGGFPDPEPVPPCQGESCRQVSVPPSLPQETTGVAGPGGNPPQRKHCPKGKHKAKRHGKTVCVKNHKHKKHHRRAGPGGKGRTR